MDKTTTQHLSTQALKVLWDWLYAIPFAILFSYVLYERLFSPLAKVPGPFWASLSRGWMTYICWMGKQRDAFDKLHQKYGKIVRVGPNQVTIADPEAIKPIYGFGSRCPKSDFYRPFQGTRKFDIFPERDMAVHDAQRRIVSRPYGPFEMRQLEGYVDNCISTFFRRMEDLRENSIDFGYWVQLFAFDVLGEVLFSKPFGFMEAGTDGGIFSKIKEVLRSSVWVGQVPWVFTLNSYVTPFIGSQLGITQRNTYFAQFARKQIEEREERGSDHRDLLGQFTEISKKKPEEFTEEAAISLCNSSIVAGSDTTASTMRSIIYYLLKNQPAYDKLVNELKDAWEAGKLSDPIQQSEADQLPYFKAVISEALRIFPAVNGPLPRVAPPEGITICGVYCPPGTHLSIHSPAAHRDKAVFGEDAEEFNPDRWFRPNAMEMHNNILAWGAGPRMCIGKNIAMMEILKLISTMLLKYDLELTDPNAEWEWGSYFITIQKGVHINMRPRVWT